MRKTILIIALFVALLLCSCAAPFDSLPPSSSPDGSSAADSTAPVSDTTEPVSESEEAETEPQTFAPEEQITNFPVLTRAEKTKFIKIREIDGLNPRPIVEWKKTAKTCPYTVQEILDAISLGDRLEDVYDKIGYPTYRDTEENPPNRGMNLCFMSYETSDGGVVWVIPFLAGYTSEDYRYVIGMIVAHPDLTGDHYPDIFELTYDEKIAAEIYPVFTAIEEKGVDYLLERGLITPYEATLYAEEEAIYQASVAAKETQEQANE